MKQAPLFLLLLLSTSAWGLGFEVRGVRGQVLFQAQYPPQTMTVGALTDRALNWAVSAQRLSEYQGDTNGVSSINRLGSASEGNWQRGEFKAYGWCYSVDGDESGLMAGEYRLTGRERLIRWWYAYARAYNGVWTSMCTPAEHAP